MSFKKIDFILVAMSYLTTHDLGLSCDQHLRYFRITFEKTLHSVKPADLTVFYY